MPVCCPLGCRCRARLGAATWFAIGLAFLALAVAIPRTGSDAAYGLDRTLAWSALTGALDVATDVDGDGYGLFGLQHDSAPFDGTRHPLALDVPGNGVDEDGYAATCHWCRWRPRSARNSSPATGHTS